MKLAYATDELALMFYKWYFFLSDPKDEFARGISIETKPAKEFSS